MEPVDAEPFVCFLHDTHSLASETEIHHRALREEPFVLYERSRTPGFFDQILTICLATGFSPSIYQEAREMQTILSMVSAGIGVSILPRSAALLGTAHVASRPLVGKWPLSEIGVAYMKSDDQNPIREGVLLELRKVVRAKKAESKTLG